MDKHQGHFLAGYLPSHHHLNLQPVWGQRGKHPWNLLYHHHLYRCIRSMEQHYRQLLKMLSCHIHQDNYPRQVHLDSNRYLILSNCLDSHHCQYQQLLRGYLGTYLEGLLHLRNCRHSRQRQNPPIEWGRLAICLLHPRYSTL